MKDPLFEEFCSDRNLSKSSQKGYYNALKDYSNFNNMNLSELCQEADDEEENRIRAKKRKILKRLKKYRTFKIQNNAAPGTIQDYFTKVKTFYRHFGIEIPYIPPTVLPESRQEEYTDIPDIDDIRNVLESTSNLKHKAIILFMMSSGTASNETTNLKIQDFINATTDYHKSTDIKDVLVELEGKKDIIPIFKLFRIKTKYLYYTCCSPEATIAIIKYLKTRPKLQKNEKLFDITNYGLMNFFGRLNENNKLGKIGHLHFFHSHALRKFQATAIEDVDLANAFQGRKPKPVTESYFKKNPKRVRERYIPHLNKLMINKVETFTIEGEEAKKIKKENKELKKKTEDQEQISIKQQEDIDFLKKAIAENPYLQVLNDPKVQDFLDQYLDETKKHEIGD